MSTSFSLTHSLTLSLPPSLPSRYLHATVREPGEEMDKLVCYASSSVSLSDLPRHAVLVRSQTSNHVYSLLVFSYWFWSLLKAWKVLQAGGVVG